jgi:hypothetical protein
LRCSSLPFCAAGIETYSRCCCGQLRPSIHPSIHPSIAMPMHARTYSVQHIIVIYERLACAPCMQQLRVRTIRRTPYALANRVRQRDRRLLRREVVCQARASVVMSPRDMCVSKLRRVSLWRGTATLPLFIMSRAPRRAATATHTKHVRCVCVAHHILVLLLYVRR